MEDKFKGRASIVRAAFLFVLIAGLFGVPVALFHPDSPLPNEWNPIQPLRVADPITPLTGWKLSQARADPEMCLNVLGPSSDFQLLEDKVDSENCSIAPRLLVQFIGDADLASFETTCATALTTAMWERHGLQPAAKQLLGSRLGGIEHSGSYNCRMIRTPSGTGSNWSTHARAMALDVRGFRTESGQSIDLIRDWNGTGPKAEFLRKARDSACDWFGLTLSPDFNALHADHFHLQVDGWGGCR